MATRTATLPARTPVVECRRILVPLVPLPGSDQAVTIACGLAAEHGSAVTALTVIEVPRDLPLDAHMLDEEAEARKLLAEAQAIGDLYGVDVTVLALRARSAGTAIVEETIRAGAEIVVLRAPRKRRLSSRRRFAFGKTVKHVLEHAPCRVMISAAPPQA